MAEPAVIPAVQSVLTRLRLRSCRRPLLCGATMLVSAGLLGGCGGGSSEASSIDQGQGADPVVVDFPIAYIKRPILLDEDGNLETTSVREPAEFRPGAELLMRDRASPSAAEISLTEGLFPDDEDGNPPLYDVKDLSASHDGTKLVFALRAPEDPDLDDDEQPTWNIWLYDRENGEVRRVIESDIAAEQGQDVAPRFLPDGRIVFSSTRQRQSKAVLLDEGKPQFPAFDEDRDEEAVVLHVMNDDGSEIEQISFNQSSDLDPAVLDDGRIVYARWDNVSNRSRISLYTMAPDGRDQQVLYGIHSHDTGPDGATVEFTKPQVLPDGRLLAILKPPGDQARGSAVPVAIDVDAFVEHDQPTFDNQGLLSDAQEFLIPGDLNLDDDQPAVQGRYASFAPLFDGTDRLLVSWSQCRLIDEVTDPDDPIIAPCTDENLANANFVEADPLFGVWMFDPVEETQQPIVTADEGEVYSEVVVMEPRVNPPVILDGVAGLDLDADLVAESVGVLHIRSVYDLDGTEIAPIETLRDPDQTVAADRPIRFVRLVKAVSMPDDDLVELDGTAFGRSQAQLMREILGYGEVHPDGSVKLRVPANVAFWIDFLDGNGRRVGGRHNNWLQLRPGEEKECTGCHSSDSELPHGRLSAEAPSVNEGAPLDGVEFPNTEPALFANAGETMAEVFARVNGIPEPSVDLEYTDWWTDEMVRPKEVAFSWSYIDLDPTVTAPTDPGCVGAGAWTALCRITINYPEHIHPLWSVDRQIFDAADMLVEDQTCTSCHAPLDAMGAPQVPAAQLDLTDGPSDQEPDHLKSYRELLFDDNAQNVLDGALIDLQVQATDDDGNLLFLTDADGNQILDVDGNPIPVLEPVTVNPPLNAFGANATPEVFAMFEPGGSHYDPVRGAGWLSDVELKLISEWLDIGAQYYNNPFVVPQ